MSAFFLDGFPKVYSIYCLLDNGHKADSRPTQKQTNIRLLIYIGYNHYIIKINWYILSISFRINFRISNLPGLFLVQIMICRPLYNFWSQVCLTRLIKFVQIRFWRAEPYNSMTNIITHLFPHSIINMTQTCSMHKAYKMDLNFSYTT